MADAANSGAIQFSNEQFNKFIAEFAVANRVNTQIDAMFKPLLARVQKDTIKKDFNLFSLFFKEVDLVDIKKHVKDNISKLAKSIKVDAFVSKPVPVPGVTKVEPTKKIASVVQVAGLEKMMARVERHGDKEIGLLKDLVKSIGTLTGKKTTKKEASVKEKTTKDIFEAHAPINANIVGIDDEVLKKLNAVLGGHGETAPAPDAKQPRAPAGILERLLGAALAGLTAAKLLAMAFDEKGPLRGVMKLIGDILLKTASTLFKGVIDIFRRGISILPEELMKRFAALNPFPAIGNLIKRLGTSIAKFVENVFLKSVNLLYKLAPNLTVGLMQITEKIGLVIKNLPKVILKGLAEISPITARVAKFVGGGLAEIASGFGKFLFKRLKLLPFIGPFIGFGFGVKRMIDGDYVGGLAEIFGNLLAIVAEPVPPLSFAISVITDLLLAGYDIKTGGTENAKKSDWNKWMAEFGQALLDTGPIRWFRDIGEALGDLLKGDFSAGLAGLANVVGDVPGIGYVLDLLGTPKNPEGKRFVKKDFNIIEKLKNEIFDNLQLVFKWAQAQVDKIRKFFGLEKKVGPDIRTEGEKAVNIRKHLAELKAKQSEEQNKSYAFDATKTRRLNELAVERTNLEAQLDQIVQKTKAAQKPATTPIPATKTPETKTEKKVAVVEPEVKEDFSEDTEQVVVTPISSEDNVEEVRQTAITKASTKEDTDRVVGAIHELKQVTQTNKTEVKPEAKVTPVSIVANTNNSVKQAQEVNVDSSRDSVFLTRNVMRNYLYDQRSLI